MRQFDETGADWLIFPITQNNGVLNGAQPFTGDCPLWPQGDRHICRPLGVRQRTSQPAEK